MRMRQDGRSLLPDCRREAEEKQMQGDPRGAAGSGRRGTPISAGPDRWKWQCHRAIVAGVAVALAGCGSSSPPPKVALKLYDDFSSGTINGAKWEPGQYEAAFVSQAAVLSHSITSARANTAYTTVLPLAAPNGSAETTLQSDVRITGSNFTRDTTTRAGIELWFQPSANRLGPGHLVSSLFARIS